MIAEIQFLEGIKEKTLPIIKLTKSRTGQTGTATFLFINPNIFQKILEFNFIVENMTLCWENKKIQTQRISIRFYKGKPFLLKAIFIFKKNQEWFSFLNFMTYYSKETGLAFYEKDAFL